MVPLYIPELKVMLIKYFASVIKYYLLILYVFWYMICKL